MSVVIDLLRFLSSLIDLGLYSLAGFIYQVFCAIATSTIIEAEDVQAFAERIYVVVGVFMLFKVGISMLKYLVNPDQLTDSKAGYSKLIWNITWALILLVSVPTIYNYAMKVQTAILRSNVIPKVILGKTAGESADFKDAGNSMIFTTLSAFVMPNYMVTDKEGKYVVLEASTNAQTCFNTNADGTVKGDSGYTGMFKMNDGAVVGLNPNCDAAFTDMTDSESKGMYVTATQNSNIQQLLDVTVDAKLNDDIQEAAGRGGMFAAKLYFLKYMWGISWIVGAFLCFIFTTFCIDMGIRAIKLAFLILISPIPVLSMVSPDKGARGMLSEWWKITWATYLDLFLRIMSIFFVMFIIQQVDLTGTIAEEFGPVVSAFAMVFIIIGALLFAKQLPELVSKLIPGMDSIVKGGLNPLKKLGEAANIASRAPLVGKGITGLSNRFATQHAMNRANKRMENAKRKDMQKDFQNKMDQVRNSHKSDADKAKAIADLEKQQAEELAAFDRESKERLKAQKELAKEEGKYAGAQAAAGVSMLGGESKPITAAGAAVAKINKESAEKVHKMQMGSLQQRQAEANLAKVQDQAEFERNQEISQKEKQIVDVQREAEIEKRMKDPKYKDMTREEARSAATREVQDMEIAKLKEQAVEKRVQAKIAQGMSETDARASATQEVAAMSQTDIAKEGNVSKVYSDAVAETAKQQAIGQGKSQAEAEKIGATAAKASREAAEERVVGSLSDKMDEVAERQGVIYNSSEYADQVKITREAKNRRNAIQSEYEKAARQQQYEGKVTTSNGVTLEGQAAIDYVDKLRVDYTKASSDYDFMNKELDSLNDKYPDDAATRKGYEAAKDYQDKKKKVTKYASKSTQVSNNDKEGGQYTVEELIQEDTVVNRLRRADTEFAGTREQIVARQTELQAQSQILQSQISDNQAAGNMAEVTRLQNELNTNNVELGRVQTSLRAAEIARSNAVTGLVNERTTIDTTLQQLEGEYQQLLNQTVQMTSSGVVDSQLTQEIETRRQDLERRINVLNDRTTAIDDELRGLGTNPATINTSTNPNVIIDTRIDGVGSFDRIGTPIRAKVENIVNQMEADVQRMSDATLSAEERKKAELAVDSALNEFKIAVKEAGDAIYSGMSSDTQKQVYDKKLQARIDDINAKRNNS